MVKKIATMKTLTKFVMFSILFIIFYSIFEFICSIIFNISHETLTECVYKFFGAEIALCGFLKIFKIRDKGDI